MVAPLVPDSALHASLLFAVGHGRTAPPADLEVPSEMLESVLTMLEHQGTPHVGSLVVEAVRVGKVRLQSDPELTISAKKYTEVRSEFITAHRIESSKGKQIWPVGATTILKRAGGSWNEALRAAGFAISRHRMPQGFGSARFTPAQFAAALRDFRQDAARGNFSTKLQNYVEWRKDLLAQGRTDIPSGPAVRNFYGSWSSALAATPPAGEADSAAQP